MLVFLNVSNASADAIAVKKGNILRVSPPQGMRGTGGHKEALIKTVVFWL